MREITIIIKTFERPRAVNRLLCSIFHNYPDINIIIADDGMDNNKNKRNVLKVWNDKNIEYLCLLYDSGLSEGRNRALKKVKTRYFMICDDDFVFTRRTNIYRLKKHLEKNNVDLVSGICFESLPKKTSSNKRRKLENIIADFYDKGFRIPLFFRRGSYGFFSFDSSSKKIVVSNVKIKKKKGYLRVDVAPNFFLAKTDIREKVLWRPELKLAEHLVFFKDFKEKGLKAMIDFEVGVNHIMVTEEGNYKKMRERKDFKKIKEDIINKNKKEGYKYEISFIHTFNKKDISYCHWKSNEHLSEALQGETDLDILVDEKQREECAKILQNSGWKQVYPPSFLKFPGVEDWIGFNEKNGKLLHLHLHYKLPTGKRGVKEQFLPWEKLVLETRVFNKKYKIFVTDPSLELILLTLRIGIKTNLHKPWKIFSGFVPQNISNEIDYLKKKSNDEKVFFFCEKMFGEEKGKALEKLVLKLLQRKDFYTICQIKIFVIKNLYCYRRYGFLKTFYHHFLYILKFKILKTCNRYGSTHHLKKVVNDGFIVAFVGVDGAGKSTIVKELKKWLAWKLDVFDFYLGRDKNILIKNLCLFMTPLRNLYFAFSKYRKIKKIEKVKMRGGIVLTDRWPQIQYRGINDGPLMEKKYKASFLYEKLYYKEKEIYELMIKECVPDIIIKLHLPAKIAIERKGDTNYERVKKKIEIVKALDFESPFVVDIDASASLESILLDIKKVLWARI